MPATSGGSYKDHNGNGSFRQDGLPSDRRSRETGKRDSHFTNDNDPWHVGSTFDSH